MKTIIFLGAAASAMALAAAPALAQSPDAPSTGLFAPITINGRRYIDGGMRSGTNADLARGHDRVLIVSLLGAAAATSGQNTRFIPAGQLDSETAASVMRLLRSLVDETGLAAVVTTHDPRVAAFADRVLEMHDGRLTALAGNLPADIA